MTTYRFLEVKRTSTGKLLAYFDTDGWGKVSCTKEKVISKTKEGSLSSVEAYKALAAFRAMEKKSEVTTS